MKEIKEIAKWITALMNTSGGLIVLYSNTPESDEKRDRWIMGFESYLMNNWIPDSLLQELVRYQYLETDDQLRIYVFVSKSPQLVTFDFHAFGRLATGVRPIRDLHRVQKMLNEPRTGTSRKRCASEMEKILTEGNVFWIGDKIPASHRENLSMEFKHCYLDTSGKIKTELPCFEAKAINNRLERNLNCLSAFANTNGGSLVLGVEEGGKYPIVRGFPVLQNPDQKAEERKVTDYLNRRLGECIWHADVEYRPEKGRDWDVHYLTVFEENGNERKIVEVCISRHSRGMFLNAPVYYVADWKDGECVMEEKKDVKEWKVHFQTATTASHVDRTDTQSQLRKHIEVVEHPREDPEGNNQRDIPEDQPQPVTAEAAVETKLPRSFKESRSEHKSDIVVQGLSLHGCCTNSMAQHITTLQSGGYKMWYPSIEHISKQLPRDTYRDMLIAFLQRRDWTGLASVIEIESETAKIPEGYGLICHMLKISEDETPLLMFCIASKYQSEVTEEVLESLASYALDVGRVLKRCFLMNTDNPLCECIFHFDIEVLLVSAEEDVQLVWDSRVVQPVRYPSGNQEQPYTIACNGLSRDLLKTRTLLKDRYGQVLTEHLTEAQAKVLHDERKRILIVRGKSGTGKTVIALHLAKEAMAEGNGREEVVYICSSEGLRSFVSYQLSRLCQFQDRQCKNGLGDQVIVLKKTNDSLSPSQKDKLVKARLIIVDDVHAIELDKHCKYWRSDALGTDDVDAMEIDEEWEDNPDDLYAMLFKRAADKTKDIRVAVFFDPEQDYNGYLPLDFDERLRRLAENFCGVLPQDTMKWVLTERIRNTQEINRFMQANQNQAKIPGTIECLNERPGDDVVYQYIGSNIEESAKIIHDKLDALELKYGARSVAILCDDDEQMYEMKSLLIDQHNRYFQDEHDYPIQHTLICNIEDFGGLEAEVILFLLPRNFGTEIVRVNWKYINVISSRARERLEFLLPWKPESEEQKQRESLTNFLELFPSAYYVSNNRCMDVIEYVKGLRFFPVIIVTKLDIHM